MLWLDQKGLKEEKSLVFGWVTQDTQHKKINTSSRATLFKTWSVDSPQYLLADIPKL